MLVRCLIFWLFAAGLLTAATAQAYKETFDEETPVKLGRPAVSKQKALRIAESFLAEIQQTRHVLRDAVLKRRLVSKHVISSQWVLGYADRIEIRISGRTGRVLRFADLIALERISKAQMFSRRNAFEGAKPPLLQRPPGLCLAAPKSQLFLGGRSESTLVPNGWYIERPGGYSVANAEDRLVFQFGPRDGRLILFERALDIELSSTKATLSAAQCSRIVASSKSGELMRTNPLGVSQPTLGYVALPHAKPKRSEYRLEADRLVLAWIVPSHSSEVWVNAETGKPIGGVKKGR